MYKTDNIKPGSKVFSLHKYRHAIIDWEVLMINPTNNRYFIIVNKESNEVKQVHWKILEYGGDEAFFSCSKDELISRYKKRTSKVIEDISKSE